ncbi:glycosyltransferase family 2 protein [Denitrobaculum tricleocarpae]|uniref:glycosyltransferase family 2 protein n=1 Tax=Denitrobaculum tricleocarpae TaxID=2591009 RepID=UPI0015D465FE|nr:glycosyltransferase family 2 protein [Denitrobaculum tricleocarpae]
MQVSYVITVYNKAPYLFDVIQSLAAEHSEPCAAAEYVFVDDGSSDNSVETIRAHQHLLPGKTIVLEQSNQGAAAATNYGVREASHDWVRLLDGDDIVCTDSTAIMAQLAIRENAPFVIGNFGYFSQEKELLPQIEQVNEDDYVVMSQDDALQRFIRNFSHNSSCMLIKKAFFQSIGGADTRLMSPDYTLALRATAHCRKMVRLQCNVTQMVEQAPGRLSSQIGRSRYDSIMAIYLLAHELMPARRDVAEAVYRRACSRAYRYARILKNRPTRHFLRYIGSRLYLPKDLKSATYQCLSAFTPDATPERPIEWTPGKK